MTAEDDAGGFGKCLDVLAEKQPNELKDGGLTRTRSAGQDNPSWEMTIVNLLLHLEV